MSIAIWGARGSIATGDSPAISYFGTEAPRLAEPLERRKPTIYFVNSMSGTGTKAGRGNPRIEERGVARQPSECLDARCPGADRLIVFFPMRAASSSARLGHRWISKAIVQKRAIQCRA